jgi:Protein of unknown function (DUF3604)
MACDRTEPPPSHSANARPEIVAALRKDLETARQPSDGGGTVRLVDGPSQVPADGVGTWTFEYTAGPLGVAENGWLFLQVSPFWNWTTPQVTAPLAPGFTRVETSAEGVELDAATLDRQLLGVRVTGRALAAGETIRLTYGAGPGARVDRFAERDSPFWFAVDGDGDGVRKLLPEPLTVEVTSGPAARLILTLPSIARPAEPVELRLALTDAVGNAASISETRVDLHWRRLDTAAGEPPDGLPPAMDVAGAGGAVRFAAPEAGIYAVDGTDTGDLVGWGGPLVVSASRPRIRWGDVHGHSNFSDGTGTPEQYFRYARDVAGLDFAALTDHDHWGIQPLAHTPELWAEICRQVAAFHQPGRFVTLAGYEWTNWLHGHRHVLYFADGGPVFSAIDPRYETPAQLWDALRPYPAMTFAHHSAGEPVATNWDYAPDPDLEPVTEVVSIHGVSEAADAPVVVRGALAGNFVRDALARGYRLGFIGSGDTHDGHPGLGQLANPSSGLAALLTDDLTRDGVRHALSRRASYATNGVRMVLDVRLDGVPMGSAVAVAEAPLLAVDVAGTAPLQRLDIVRVGHSVDSFDLGPSEVTALERLLTPTRRGDVVYVRVLQVDGGMAWSSPFFVGEARDGS